MRHHVSSSIERVLELEDEMLVAMFERPINWIREDLEDRKAAGELLIGSADCEGFSPINGCPGHPTTFLEKYGNVEVRALSWKQPFASLMLHGKVETRVWPTTYRGWVLICASKTPYGWKPLIDISGEYQYTRMCEAFGHSPAITATLGGMAIAVGYLSGVRLMTEADDDVCFAMHKEPWQETRTSKKTGITKTVTKELWCHIYTDVQPIIPFEWSGVQGWKTLTDDVKAKIKFS